MVRVALGLVVLLLLYETVGRSFITSLTLVAVFSLLILNEPTITAQFRAITKGQPTT